MTKIEMKSKGAALRSSEKKHRRLLSAAAVLLAVCLAFVGVAGAEVTEENVVASVETTYYDTLANAISAANSISGGATVKLLKDVTLGEIITISGNVTINGNDKTITRDDSYTGTLFTVNPGAKLTLDGNLTIDGANNWAFNQELYNADLAAMQSILTADAEKYFTLETGAPVAAAYMITLTKGTSDENRGGTVNLLDVTIKNHYSQNSQNSGIVSASQYTTVVLNGAKITHCAGTHSSGVVVQASGLGITVTMEEGTVISGNHVGGNHGVFKVYSGTVFTMNGGTITKTTGWNSNGVVAGMYGGTFIMNGGEISQNSAVYGPSNGRNAAIYLHANSVMEMNGGIIKENTGRSRGGIDSSRESSSLTITGGTVEDNISLAGNTNADIGGETGTWEITGGTFTQDVSQWCAEGYVPAYNAKTGKWGVFDEDTVDSTFLMTVLNSEGSSVESSKSISLIKSIEWGAEKVVSGYTANLEVRGDWKQESNVVITYPISLLVKSDKTLILNPGIFEIGRYADTEAATNSPAVFGNLTISGGNYLGGKNGMVLVKYGSLEITGGTFTAAEDSNLKLLRIDDGASDASITVTGGTFYNFDPTKFVPEGYCSVKTSENSWTVKKMYTITVTATEGGTAFASKNTAMEGGEIILTATPNEGYSFFEWVTKSDIVISQDGKFRMPASDVTVKAVFKENSAEGETAPPTSGGGGGDGGALSFPRFTENGGLVDFGASKVVKAVLLPEGSRGSVLLKVDTVEKWPKKLETEYTFDISVEKLGEGMAYIHFEISESTLESLGITPADICAYHLVDDVWVKLITTYEVKERTVFYEAETDSFSPFKLVIEEGAAEPKAEETEPVIPPTEEPENKPEDIAPPLDPPVQQTEPESPSPILAVLAGLGAAAVLRRK
ncbi:PGF-pre-PGF domain-containing protein [Methanocorpusculaceae archaeon]|nr:PGF-pre-PGF domain-containing protein [Methanocorpusculaceae archaeon]